MEAAQISSEEPLPQDSTGDVAPYDVAAIEPSLRGQLLLCHPAGMKRAAGMRRRLRNGRYGWNIRPDKPGLSTGSIVFEFFTLSLFCVVPKPRICRSTLWSSLLALDRGVCPAAGSGKKGEPRDADPLETCVFNGQAERLRDPMTRRNEQLDAACFTALPCKCGHVCARRIFIVRKPGGFSISGEQAEILSV